MDTHAHDQDELLLYLRAAYPIVYLLTPEEQRALQRHRRSWDDYSSERQNDMRRGAQRYLELPPDRRRELEQQRRKYEQLSPQERQRLREEYQRRQR